MATYIDDAGSYELDAELIGVENTAWSKNATDRAIWFSDIGTANTGLILPDTEWIVYEVYGMTGTLLTADYTSIATSTKLHGKKEYTDIIGVILTTLNAWRTALDKTNYDTYDIIATHYKGSDKADVYEADETVAFTTATTTDGDFTGQGSEWVIEDDLFASQVNGTPTYGSELLYSAGNDNGVLENTAVWVDFGNVNPDTLRTYNSINYFYCSAKEANAGQYQSFTTDIGTSYRVEATLIGADVNNNEVFDTNSFVSIDDAVPTSANDGDHTSTYVTGNIPTDVFFEFTASATTTYFSISSDTDWKYSNASRMSVKEIL